MCCVKENTTVALTIDEVDTYYTAAPPSNDSSKRCVCFLLSLPPQTAAFILIYKRIICKRVGYIPIHEIFSPRTWNYYYSTASNGAFYTVFRVGMSTNWNSTWAKSEERKNESRIFADKEIRMVSQSERGAHFHNSASELVVYITLPFQLTEFRATLCGLCCVSPSNVQTHVHFYYFSSFISLSIW